MHMMIAMRVRMCGIIILKWHVCLCGVAWQKEKRLEGRSPWTPFLNGDLETLGWLTRQQKIQHCAHTHHGNNQVDDSGCEPAPLPSEVPIVTSIAVMMAAPRTRMPKLRRIFITIPHLLLWFEIYHLTSVIRFVYIILLI